MNNMYGIIILFAALAILVGMQGVQAQSEEGLVAEWHFDGDAKDSSGNGNDGTVYGATFVDGKFGKALSFDGVDDYINIPNIINNQVQGTVEAWVKYLDTNPGLNGDYIFTATKEFPITGKFDGTDLGIHPKSGMDIRFGIWYKNAWCWAASGVVPEPGSWYHVVGTWGQNGIKIYINGALKGTNSYTGSSYATNYNIIGASSWPDSSINGLIDEVRIYNRALSAEEIKAQYEQGQTALTVKKDVSPYSIRQYQTTNVTIQIKNTGSSVIRDIEVTDSTNSNLELIGGDFPNPKKYNSLGPGESRDIRYILTSKESGTFILYPATVSYSDSTGNIKVVKSESVSLTVVPSSEGSPEISSPSDIGTSSAVLLHGEKTDVVLGEDILLKLSAVNLITKPPMSVQVMIYPPSGMSVTGSEFVKSGAGIYTTTYTLNPGDGKDIEVHIKSNQVGDFNVKGRIVYYFGEEKDKAEDHTLNLPIKVRKEPGQTAPAGSADVPAKAPGFAGEIAITGILLVALLIKRYRTGE